LPEIRLVPRTRLTAKGFLSQVALRIARRLGESAWTVRSFRGGRAESSRVRIDVAASFSVAKIEQGIPRGVGRSFSRGRWASLGTSAPRLRPFPTNRTCPLGDNRRAGFYSSGRRRSERDCLRQWTRGGHCLKCQLRRCERDPGGGRVAVGRWGGLHVSRSRRVRRSGSPQGGTRNHDRDSHRPSTARSAPSGARTKPRTRTSPWTGPIGTDLGRRIR